MLDWIFLVSLAQRLIWTIYFIITKITNGNQTGLLELGNRISYMCTMQIAQNFVSMKKGIEGESMSICLQNVQLESPFFGTGISYNSLVFVQWNHFLWSVIHRSCESLIE